jgi:16S rRNA (guanine966-N2)-methyltransferase
MKAETVASTGVRVIAGNAKGTQLRSPSSEGTRPISDRGKEGLFNILAPRIPGSRFLDLFAGTGGVGIEALSREAASATFVELDGVALGDLRWNLQRTGLDDDATIVVGDVFRFVERTSPEPFDIVFVAPPQWQGLWTRTIMAIDAQPALLTEDAVVVVQCDPKEIEDPALTTLERTDLRKYGNVAFLFHERV